MSFKSGGDGSNLSFGDPDRVFARGKRSGSINLGAPAFYTTVVTSTLLGYIVMGVMALFGNDFLPSNIWLRLGVTLGTFALMVGGSLIALWSRNWAVSLGAYLGVVSAPFGLLFGPFVHLLSSDILFAGFGSFLVAVLVACVIGLAIKTDLYNTRFGQALDVALIIYVVLLIGTSIFAASYPGVMLWTAYVGIILFFLMLVRDVNRAKFVHKDLDTGVDIGMQLWLTSLNMLLQFLKAYAAAKRS